MSINFRTFLPRIVSLHQEQRPILKDHRSSVEGVFICGDLAGEPLIKTSVKDALETLAAVEKYVKQKSNVKTDCDIVVCGAGVAGLTAAIEAKKLGMSVIILEQNKVLQTIIDFPENKHIYANPQEMELNAPFSIKDSSKEEFLNYAEKIIAEQQLGIIEGESIKGLKKEADGGIKIFTSKNNTYSGKAVILAIGRRGNPRKLGIKGENSSKVHYNLLVPRGYEGRKVVVVGGGNSAVEAAMSLCDMKADVTISYRKNEFFRATKENKALMKKYIAADKIKVIYNSNPTEIESEKITLNIGNKIEKLPADDIFIFAGAESPNKLLENLGLKIENTWSKTRIAYFIIFVAFVWCFFAFSKWGAGTSLIEFPFSLLGKRWDIIPNINPGYVKMFVYSFVVAVFAIPAIKRWRSYPRNRGFQTARYTSILVSQLFFLFIFPEFILTRSHGWFPSIIPETVSSNAWRFYGVVMPFPLVYPTFFNSTLFWIVVCSFAAFIALPVFVYFHGKKLCSWICGCGCLAETLGDRYRRCAPRGDASRKIENYLLWPILIWAFLGAGLHIYLENVQVDSAILKYTFNLIDSGYSYIVDFILAAVVGVGFYFLFSGRIWCRYFCPLAHYMRLLSAWYGKFKISPLDKCIACGECSRYCQMGIDVMQFALKEEKINNKNSSCIGCGVCISVCPMDNLKLGDLKKNTND